MNQLNKYLYPLFDHWFRGGNIFVYSDPHFSDPEMVYLRKDYIGDEEQIKRINSKVGKKDTIIFLGDIGNIDCIKKIRGYKVLIMGNHDSGKTNYQRVINEIQTFDSEEISEEEKKEIVKRASKMMLAGSLPPNADFSKYFRTKIEDNHLFDEVYEGPLMINEKLMLSHEPLDLPPCIFNIYGHDHSSWFDNKGRGMNVCAEWINYTPISLLDFLKKGGLKDVDDIHRITIDRATERKNNK